VEGDKLIVQKVHIKAARQLLKLLLPQISEAPGSFIITIAGESGGGKSEIAITLCEMLLKEGIKSYILQQDDYFIYPPKTNAKMRRLNIKHVGLSEVNLALLDQNLKDIQSGITAINKPLVSFDSDKITQERVRLEGVKLVIVEGTYTTILSNTNRHIFIDRTHIDTREARQHRAREEQDGFLEQVLKIEHGIISAHKAKADVIINKDYEVKCSET
jgi:uridine kinase